MPMKRRTFRKRKPRLFTQAQAKQLKKMVDNRLIKDSEKKYLDTSATNSAVTYVGFNNTAAGIDLTAVAQGVAQGQRVGDMLRPTNLTVKYNLYWHNNAATTDGNTVRVLLVKWKNVGNPTLSNILQSVTQYNVVNSAYHWIDQHDDDYTVLYDKRHSCNYSQQTAHGEIRVNPRSLSPINFDPAGGSGNGVNKIYMYMCSDDSGIVSGYPTGSYYARLQYVDD